MHREIWGFLVVKVLKKMDLLYAAMYGMERKSKDTRSLQSQFRVFYGSFELPVPLWRIQGMLKFFWELKFSKTAV